MIKYSVIIPHKNCSELLHRCITSIPSNSDFEIILVDDCSDDIEKVKQNITALNRKDIRVIYSECGRGAGYSRNVGLRESSGEWILFLDADDFFSETIADIVKITESTKADIVYFKHQGKYSDNLEDCIRYPIRNELISQVLNSNCEKNRTLLKFGDTVPWGKIYRRSLISKHKIAFDEIICCEDVMFTTECALHANEIEILPNIGYNITFRRNSLSMQRSKKHQYTAFVVQLRRNDLISKCGHPELCTRVLSHIVLALRLYGFWEAKKYISTAHLYKQGITTGLSISRSEVKGKLKELFISEYHKN